jgi:tRNA (mo5U34)-methyltransferase
MSPNLQGKSVLDIGAWDGFFSFEAERRGARKVVAIDEWKENTGQNWRSRYGGQDLKKGFELARKVLGSKVEDKQMSVMNISPENIGIFDCVLFLGVLYHLRHPLLALEKVSSVTKEQLIVETHVKMIGGKRPMIVFYPKNELRDDPTNWWGPNPSAMESMLKDVGFRKVEIISKAPLDIRLAGAVLNRGHSRVSLFARMRTGRMVFHAWK